MEPNADESESVEHQREEQWTTGSNYILVRLNTPGPPDIIETGSDVPTDTAETAAGEGTDALALKGYFTSIFKCYRLSLTPMLFQTRKSFVRLRNAI